MMNHFHEVKLFVYPDGFGNMVVISRYKLIKCGQTQRKRRRYLEVMSLICSTVGLNMIIACFCGLANNFGFKSPDIILQCAFGFLMASVLLGIAAMISSVTGYECLKISSLVTPNFSLLCRLLIWLYSSRNKYIQEPVISCKLEDNQSAIAEESATNVKNITLKCLHNQPRVHSEACGIFPETSRQSALLLQRKDTSSETKAPLGVCYSTNEICTKVPKSTITSRISEPDKSEIVLFTTPKTNQNIQETLKCYSNDGFQPSKGRFTDHRLPAIASGQSYALSPSKCNKQSHGKAILQLKKRPNAFSFDQSLATGNSSGITKASRQISCDIERDDGRSRLTLTVQDCFVAEIDTNKDPFQIQLNPREIVSRCLTGVTNPYEVGNTYFEEGRGFNFQEGFNPSEDANQRIANDHVSDVISKMNRMNFLY